MTEKEARHILAETQADYTQKQKVLRGLQILATYDEDMRPAFGQDQIGATTFDTTVTRMTKEEGIELALCGWFEHEESWSHY